MADCVYLKLSESCLAEKKKVRIKDVATVVSGNPDAKYDIEKMELASFTGTKEQKVISVMYIIELIQQKYPELQVEALGATDVVVYYRTYDTSDNVKQILKFRCEYGGTTGRHGEYICGKGEGSLPCGGNSIFSGTFHRHHHIF